MFVLLCIEMRLKRKSQSKSINMSKKILFQGYKEVVEKTSRLLELNPSDLHFELGEFFRENEICSGSLEAKKYLHILRSIGWSVKKRKGVWYLNNKPIEFYNI